MMAKNDNKQQTATSFHNKKKHQEMYSKKVELLKIEKICTQEAEKAQKEHDVMYSFDHVSTDIRVVFVKEKLESPNQVTHQMLEPLLARIKKINKKMYLGIIVHHDKSEDDHDFTQEELDNIEQEVAEFENVECDKQIEMPDDANDSDNSNSSDDNKCIAEKH